MNFKDDILSKPSLVGYWRLGGLDTWKHGGVVDAIPQPVRRNLMLDPGFETSTVNWSGSGSFLNGTSVLSLDPANAMTGANAMKVVTPATAAAGTMSQQVLQLIGGVTYSISIYVKEQAGGSTLSRVGLAELTSPNADYTIANNVTIPTGYTRYQALVTPLRTGPHSVYLRVVSATATTYWVDNVACVASPIDAGYADGDGLVLPNLFARAQGALAVGGGAALSARDVLALSTAFSGSAADYLSVPHQAALALTGDMSIVAIANPTSFAAYRVMAGKGNAVGGAPYAFFLTGTSGLPGLERGNGTTATTVSGAAAPVTGVPSMLGVSVSGATATHYLNGAANGSGSFGAQAIADLGTVLSIGLGTGGANPFLGSMSDLAIFCSALSASEMLAFAQEAGFA